MTVIQALRQAERRLHDSGVPEPTWDAELLLRHALGWDRATLLTRSSEELPPPESARFAALVERRAARLPLQHLVGEQYFWGRAFLVTPDVLIPRPETEGLVEAALELLRPSKAPLIVDVGTGSGCIALTLAAERPDAVVHAVDVSPAALRVAAENARRLGLSQVVLHEGDLLAPVTGLGGTVDCVVSNPPYVDPADLPGLAPEVRDHEPRTALLAPDPPYGVYRRLAAQSGTLLRPGGGLLVEVGQGMADGVADGFRAEGLVVTAIRPDLAGIPRVVAARRP